MLWYANTLGDRSEPVLSFGLPYSHSFFLRYTPTCKSQFNLTTSRWVQDKACVVPYYNIEGIQSMLHSIVAFLIIIFSFILICERRTRKFGKQKLEEGYSSSRSSKSGQVMPNVATPIYGDPEKKNNKSIPPPPDSINDISSGYMNSSYEAVKEDPKKISGTRRSKKKSTNGKKISRPKSSGTSEVPSQQDDYSSVTTKSLTNSSVESRQVKPRPRQPFPPARTNIPKKMVNRSVSPIRRNSDEGFSEEEVSKQYSKMRQKPPGQRTQSLAEQRLSQAALEQMRKESFKLKNTAVGSSLRIKQKIKTPAEGDREDSGEYLEYIRAERRNSNPNLTSLISFDPKSNTLIRVTELSNDEDEFQRTSRSDSNIYKEIADSGVKLRTRTTSQESVPSIQAPILCGSQLNLDSGHPSSSTNSASPDWSQAGISCVTQRPAMSPPLPPPKMMREPTSRSIMGYESSICESLPPVTTDVNSRPIMSYKSSTSESSSQMNNEINSRPILGYDPCSQMSSEINSRPILGYDPSSPMSNDVNSRSIMGYESSISEPIPPMTNDNNSRSIMGYEPSICEDIPPRPTKSSFQVLQNPELSKCVRSTSFSSKPNFVSLSTAIPLLDTLPEPPFTRFLSTQNSKKVPDYALPPSNDCYYSPGDYGLKLSDDSPLLAYSKQDSSKSSDSTQFDSKPVPSAPIILSNAGLLV
ncbi:hypothetical protein FO519_004916 [Halicephalobus sp. NKZ332]|nr:hypothetical protein FO519_004916 [Halicephalobus sp. NKZ332]